MGRRFVHYEAAFEDYIRSRGWPYISVDEKRKAIFAGARIKSFDFLVHPPGERAWLVDVKGRKFPYEVRGGLRYWENWVTRHDLEGLRRWHEVFGDQYEPVLMFAYWLTGLSTRDPGPDVHVFRDICYAFVPVKATDYEAHARQRSPKWDTVTVSTRDFRSLIRPIGAGA